jgi:hypothetical protein
MADNEINEQTNQVNTEPLRIANPLPESNGDSDEEQSPVAESPVIEQPVAHEITHFHVPAHHEVAWFYAQRFGLQALLFLQLLWTYLNKAASTTQAVSTNLVRSIQTQLYVFFQGSSYPYRAQSITLAGPGIAPVEWYYNADTKVFMSSTVYTSTNEYQTHHLQWLAGEIKYNDLMLYDVTEFLQQVKWAGAERPSPSLVMAAWSLYSGIVLNLREGLVLKTINEDGTESSLPLRG